VDLDPAAPGVRRTLGIAFYRLAASRAEKGDKAEALNLLRQGIDKWPTWRPLRANFEFTSLRGDPEFEALAARQWANEAVAHGEKCASEPSRQECALQALSLCLLGRADEAAAAAAKAASLEETSSGCQALAWYHACARNRDEVIRHVKRCRELGGCPSYIRIHEDYTWLAGDTEFEALFTEASGEGGETSGD
jgi:hypothetical protein